MSNYSYKYGEGFTIRYGGAEGIRWFNTPTQDAHSASIPTTGLGAAEPIGMAIEAVKAAGLLLQWWEMRKQTLLQTAQFEERRIPWLTDMLFQWATEVQGGEVRLDTIIYFDREVSRFLDAAQGNKLVDLPSSLLLQLERSSRAMARINGVIESLRIEHEGRPNFTMEGEELPFRYMSSVELLDNNAATEKYLELCSGASQAALELGLAAGIGAAGGIARAIMPYALAGPLGILGAVAFWGYDQISAAKAKAQKQERLQEFRAMLSLALELRSCRTLLTLASACPESLIRVEIPDSALLSAVEARSTHLKG